MRRMLAAAFAAILLVAACGEAKGLSDTAADSLQPRVAEIRSLAEQRRAGEATAKIAELRMVVEDLQSGGDISDARAEEVLAAADTVESRLVLVTTTTQPPPPPRHDEDDEDEKDEDEKEEREDKDD